VDTLSQLSCTRKSHLTRFVLPASTLSCNITDIHAGVSGLASLKECLAEGIEADVFESRGEIGGQWAYQAEPDEKGELQSSMYDGVILNSCRDTTGFSDFPIDPARHGEYFTHREMHRYILEYADHFALHKHISLRTKVLNCTQNEVGRWTVKFQEAGAEPAERTYDALISATGINSIPVIPDFKGKDTFKGEFLHSHYYRRPGRFEGKRVVLIGAGSGAIDLSSELAPGSREVHIVTRRGAWVIPRYVLGKPVEAWDSRATQVWLPSSVAEWLQTVLLNFVQGKHPKELRPDHRLMQQNPTIRSEFLERVHNGTIKVHRAEVESFTETGIMLTNGETIEADVVISCTGYRRLRPYLPDDILRTSETPEHEADLYKLVVPARHPNIYFVGYIEAAGPSPPAMEAQARFAVGAIAGHVQLPEGEALLKEIRAWQAWHSKTFVRSERHVNTETYVPYIDSLLKPLGANPTFGRLLAQVFTSGHPLRALSVLSAVYLDVTSSAQWRLCGYGKNEELARETVLRISGGKGELSVKEKELLAK
jgi:dimethylaniline monooxygenase (N-oxide forming)